MPSPDSGAERPESGWTTVERPGYFGRYRDEKHREYDERFGAGNWRIAWETAGRSLERPEAIALYEEAYYEFFRSNTDVFDRLIREASDVYDDAPSNVHSGLDYDIQETNRTHIQDISIRRCVARFGHAFHGDELIRIRDSLGDHPLSMTLSPGRVPFHRPELITQPEREGWWEPGSVESFYQSNKVLQVRQQG